MQSFCRICFQQTIDSTSSVPLHFENHKIQLIFCIPQMDLRTLTDTKLCKDCVVALDVTHKFKIKCREVEDKFNKQRFNVTERFVIKQEISLNNSMYTVCRICLRDVTDNSFSFLTERQFYKYRLMFCVPEMDLRVISDINLCNDCQTTIDKIYTFKMKCLDTEKNIREYLKSHHSVDFKDLSVWCNVVQKNEINDVEDFIIKQEEIDFKNEDETTTENLKEQIMNDKFVPVKTEELKVCGCTKEMLKYQKCRCNNRMCNNTEYLPSKAPRNNFKNSKYEYGTITGEKSFRCSQCEYSTVNKSLLTKHVRIHTSEKPFKCSYCDYSARRKSHIKQHTVTHTGEKSFKCSYCDYRAALKSCLDRHLHTHTGEKPFKCPHCEYSCGRKSYLKQHTRIHTGEKPFKCLQCNYSAADKANLKQHIRTHTGVKPFKCPHCEYTAAQKQHLRQHILHTHW